MSILDMHVLVVYRDINVFEHVSSIFRHLPPIICKQRLDLTMENDDIVATLCIIIIVNVLK